MLALDKVSGLATVLVLPANQLLASGNLAVVQVVGQDGELVLSGEVVLRSSNIFLSAVLILDILDGDVLQLDIGLEVSVEVQVSNTVLIDVLASQFLQGLEGDLLTSGILSAVLEQSPAGQLLTGSQVDDASSVGQDIPLGSSSQLTGSENRGSAVSLGEDHLDLGQGDFRLLDLANLNVHGVVGADVNIAGLAQFIASGDFLQQRSAESGSTVLQFNLLDSVGQRRTTLQNVADIDNLGRLLNLANLNVHGVVGADVNIAGLAQFIASGDFLQQRSAESGSTVLQFNLLDSVGQRRTTLQNVADIDNLGRLLNLANLNVHGVVGADVNIASLAQLIVCGNLLQQRGAESGGICLEFNLLDFSIQRRTALQNVADVNKFGSGLRSLENGIQSQRATLSILAQLIPAIVGTGLQGNFGVTQRYPTSQFLAFGNNAVIFKSIAQSPSVIFLLERIRTNWLIINIVVDSHYCVICKRCKRYAHDNHERGRQQSKQTSFEIRFLHVISPIH